MTGRELIAHLETCNLDKEVGVVISVVDEDSEGKQHVLIRKVKIVIENEDMIGIQ